MFGAELALRGHRVALIDRDQGRHLSRVFDFYPPGIGNLVLGEDSTAALRIVDTAPEVDADRAVGYLREAHWALVPVKGPEAGSVLALPLLLEWLGGVGPDRVRPLLQRRPAASDAWAATPEVKPRPVTGPIQSHPVLNGLHHAYERAA